MKTIPKESEKSGKFDLEKDEKKEVKTISDSANEASKLQASSPLPPEATSDSMLNSESRTAEEAPEKKPEVESKLQKKIKECLEKFYEMMNEQARELGLKKTNYASAHGMYVE